jgi:hypothetical protein
MRIPLLICLTLLALLSTAASHGEERGRQFQVELIVFAHLNAYDGGEKWPVEERGLVSPSGWTDLGGRVQLVNSGRRLTAVADALQRSNHYRPLVHLHWRQAVQAPAAAQAIDLEELLGAASRQTTPRVEGSLRLSVARYLHLETDLRLITGERSYLEDTPTTAYRLQQSRRMRSGELHYIDHPRFGVLALITPYAGEQ